MSVSIPSTPSAPSMRELGRSLGEHKWKFAENYLRTHPNLLSYTVAETITFENGDPSKGKKTKFMVLRVIGADIIFRNVVVSPLWE